MRGVLCAIVLGSLAAAAYGFNLYAHNQVGDDSRLTLMSDSGLVVDANFFATSFLLPIAICLSVAFAHRSGWARLLAVGAIFAMLASIFLSGSRGAFISVTLVMLYFVFKTGNRLALLAIAAGIGSSFVLFPTLLRRWTQAQTNSNGSGRTFIWDVGARALADQYHWLTGAGLGTFPLAYNKALSSVYQSTFEGWSRPAHNVLIGNAVELGIFGAALLVFAWWRTFRQAANIAPNSGNYPLRLAAEASVLGLFVNALFIDPLLIKYYWLAFMIPFMLHNVEAPHLMRQMRPISGRFSAFRLRREALAVRRPRSG
jgi:O-antigen ligase